MPDTFGPLSVSWLASADDGRRLQVAFDQLRITKGSAGLFKTALFQSLELTNLRLRTHAGLIDRPAQTGAADTADAWSDPLQVSPQLFSKVLQLQQSGGADTLRWSVPDLGRTAAISVHGFDWQITDSGTTLSVQSRLALVDHKQPDELLLKGYVVLQSPDRVIESNHVIYDLQARRFRIPGPCMLTVGSEKRLQHNMSLDMHLNFDMPLAAQPKGENICLASPSP